MKVISLQLQPDAFHIFIFYVTINLINALLVKNEHSEHSLIDVVLCLILSSRVSKKKKKNALLDFILVRKKYLLGP